ncbi:MAG: tetratricopeptide repeat protein [Betaproteobacteria bacterium]|nr:tetratricopeptide repeat protein [Betaproteobacteria bacterium]
MQTYTLRDATALLGLSRSVILRLVASGYVSPARGPRREYRFSFPDMVLLRTAQGLQAAQIPPRHIVRSLRRLRERLPAQMPLAGLRIAAIGREVVVRDGGTPWQADSGQLLFDFEVAPATGTVQVLRPRAPQPSPSSPPPQSQSPPPQPQPADRAAPGPMSAARWFARAVALESDDPAAADAAYRQAIAAAPDAPEAYLNLGVLLGDAGRHAEAEAVYRAGLARRADQPLLHFNLGVALEDQRRFDAAIPAYEAALALDPALADAHFNLARLYDQLGHARQAIRHFSAYRRLHPTTGGGP